MHPTAVFVLIAVLVAAVIWLAVYALRRRSSRVSRQMTPPPEPTPTQIAEDDRRRAAIIVNPTKFDDVDAVRGRVRAVCEAEGWGEPIWLETTVEDPGTGQAREALKRGADLVCPLGGDGTVRAVAAGIIDSDMAIGLLPGGTGNLLARNLDLPVDDLEAALRVALTGRDVAIDVGTVDVVVPGDTQDEHKDHYFLVMAGMGFDASVVADAPEKLKAQFGWPAYVVAGMKHLNGKRFQVDASIDGGQTFHRRVRTVVVGNVGRLQGGFELLPDAHAADGALDVVMLSPKGLIGWASVGAYIATRQHRGHRRVEHYRCKTMHLELGSTQVIQLDGDPIGSGRVVAFAVKPHCLKVRVA
ncbi:MAG: diacylglycerol kinase family protein [Micrococcales bacterium]|nr:diacylglycerol kinase family protein [Micrococcales bacterium]